MKYNFIITLPIKEDDLDKSELFVDEITEMDIKNKKSESIEVTSEQSFKNFIYIEKELKLINFLPDVIQHLIRKSLLNINLYSSFFLDKKKRFNSLKIESFPKLKINYQREILNKDKKNSIYFHYYEKLDCIKTNIEYFKNFGDKLNKLLLSTLKIKNLDNWEEEYKGDKTDLLITLYINSDYGLGNNFIHKYGIEIFRTYLVYFYKNLVLFKKKWKATNFDEIIQKNISRKKNLQFFSSPSLQFNNVIKNFNDLKTHTNFLSTKETFNLVLNLPEKNKMEKIIKEGFILKRGEGPFDYNWNKRYFILQKNKILYFNIKDEKEKKGEIDIKNGIFGNIENFDGQEFAFSINLCDQNRFIWLSHSDEKEISDWRNKLIFDQVDILKIKNIKEKEEEKKQIIKTPLQKISDQDFESGRQIEKFEKLLDENNWEFYKVYNLAKFFFKKEDENVFVKTNFLLDLIKKNIKVIIFSLFISSIFYLFILSNNLYTIILTITLLLIFNKLIIKKKFLRITLKAEIIIKKEEEKILAYIVNLTNLNKWNKNYDNFNFINKTDKFEINLIKRKMLLDGKLRQNENNILIELKNNSKSYNCSELINIQKTNVNKIFKIRYIIQIYTSKINNYFDLFSEAEKQLESISRLRDNLVMKLRPRKSFDYKKLLFTDSLSFFLKGKPFLENKLNFFEDEKAEILVLKKIKRTNNDNNDNYSLSVRKINKYVNYNKNSNSGIAYNIFQKFGEEIFLKSKNLLNINFPIKNMSKKSLFSYFTNLLKPAPLYISLAVESNNKIEKLKNIISFLISGLSEITFCKKIPFLPFKGETCQFIFDDFTTVDFEMIRDNQFSFLMFNKFKGWAVTGQPFLKIGLNNNFLEIKIEGKFKVFFENNQKYGEMEFEENKEEKKFKLANILKSKDYIIFEYPNIKIENFFDPENIIFSFFDEIKLDYPSKNLISNISFSKSSKKSENMKIGHFVGDIKNTKNLKNVSTIFSKWPNHLNFDDICYWDNFIKFPNYSRVNRFLPSEVSIRDEIYNLRMKQVEKAEEIMIKKSIGYRNLNIYKKSFAKK